MIKQNISTYLTLLEILMDAFEIPDCIARFCMTHTDHVYIGDTYLQVRVISTTTTLMRTGLLPMQIQISNVLSLLNY